MISDATMMDIRANDVSFFLLFLLLLLATVGIGSGVPCGFCLVFYFSSCVFLFFFLFSTFVSHMIP